MQREYPRSSKMKTNEATPLMKAAAKQAEAALILANDIVDRVLHEDWHDNPQMVVGVMMAMAETYTALTIREGFDEVVEALKVDRDERERTVH
jgi:hypothetical protein